jgi:glucose-6-phosphate 1-dehydrogenase
MSKALVIFGATGDLSLRMLLPSLYFLDLDGLLPADWRLVGTSRSDLTGGAFAKQAHAAVVARAGEDFDEKAWARFEARLAYVSVDVTRSAAFETLARELKGSEETIFHLSTSPGLYETICENLRESGLAHAGSRVLVEKPTGRDLASCREINDVLARTFDEARIFRVDHYLGKEAVQNLIALRFANTFFEPLWDHVAIAQVQITVSETIGVEGRWAYYDDYGAIRDMVQNHILQLLCLVAMEPPAHLDPDSVRNEKVKVLRSLRPIVGREVERKTARGQYARGVADGAAVPGYAQEADGHESRTETFAALRADIDNWRWAGVPFYLRTGKRLARKVTEIAITLKPVPHLAFQQDGSVGVRPNQLILTLQPNEGVSLSLGAKIPGSRMRIRPVNMEFLYGTAFMSQSPEAYERLILDAMRGDATLFTRNDEVEAQWRIVDPIVTRWESMPGPLAQYEAGTQGPGEFEGLLEHGAHWRAI